MAGELQTDALIVLSGVVIMGLVAWISEWRARISVESAKKADTPKIADSPKKADAPRKAFSPSPSRWGSPPRLASAALRYYMPRRRQAP